MIQLPSWLPEPRGARRWSILTERGEVGADTIVDRAEQIRDRLIEQKYPSDAFLAVASEAPEEFVARMLAVYATGLGTILLPDTTEGTRREAINFGAVATLSDGGTSRDSLALLTNQRYVPTDRQRTAPPSKGRVVFRTSGTGGMPSWVMHTEPSLHRAVQARIESLAQNANSPNPTVTEHRAISQLIGTPRACSIGLSTISGFSQLCHCVSLGSAIVASEGGRLLRFAKLIVRYGAGSVVTTPSTLRILERIETRLRLGIRVAVIGLGGEVIDAHEATAAEELFNARILQGYGSTELGGSVSNSRIWDPAEVRHQTIGTPFEDVEMKSVSIALCDGDQAPPVEQLWVRSAERYATSICNGSTNWTWMDLPLIDGWFPTGDAIEESRSGITIRGRVSDAYIRRGTVCFTTDVESKLTRAPGVTRVLVLVDAPHGANPRHLRAICETTRSVASLKHWISSNVPEPWRPDDVAAVPQLPLTTSGKLLRNQLENAYGS